MDWPALRFKQSACNLARCRFQGQLGAHRRRHSAAAATLFRGALALAITAMGCAGARPGPSRPPATEFEAAAHRAYRTLTESLDIDPGALRGRTIVLDPGHGGGYRGATGSRGAAEADVNLAVSLFLWGLLADAGANVHLTRTADRDFIGGEVHPPAIRTLPSEARGPAGAAEGSGGQPGSPALAPPESLRADLAARVALANALDPDLFISIHHNADASGDTTRNQTLTFYRLGDAGPSLDAAQAIHRHLMRNLGTASGQVLSGNYHVLRESAAAAAVLGEPSFLTNPIFEEKLVRIDRVELEATAYFLGIVDYFTRGVALVSAIAPADTVIEAATAELRAEFTGSPVDPATVEFLLDGAVLPASPVAGPPRSNLPGSNVPSSNAPRSNPPGLAEAYAAAPVGPLANGRHRLTVRARCLGGNAVAPTAVTFEIRRPPAEIHAEPWPPWNGGYRPGPLGLKVLVRDHLGLAVADSTPVEVTGPGAARGLTRGGEAWVQLAIPDPLTTAWRVRAGQVETTVPLVTPGAPRAWSGRLSDARSGARVAGAELRDGEGGPFLGHTSPEGGFAVRAPSAGQLAITAPGYLPALVEETARAEPTLSPVLGGVLHGRTIVVDAAGGGSEPLFVSPTGVRAADTALDLARRLAGELGRAGARPELTRADDRTLPELARVETAERVEAELVVRLSTGGEPRIRHYPGSDRGARLARAMAHELEVEAAMVLPVRPEVTPVLQQTSMPAVELLLPPPATQEAEARDLDLDFRRRVARALLLALAAEAGLDPAAQGTALLTSKAPRLLVDGAIVLPLSGSSLLLRALEPAPTRHRAATLDPLRGSGQPVDFAVGAGDTVRLAIP